MAETAVLAQLLEPMLKFYINKSERSCEVCERLVEDLEDKKNELQQIIESGDDGTLILPKRRNRRRGRAAAKPKARPKTRSAKRSSARSSAKTSMDSSTAGEITEPRTTRRTRSRQVTDTESETRMTRSRQASAESVCPTRSAVKKQLEEAMDVITESNQQKPAVATPSVEKNDKMETDSVQEPPIDSQKESSEEKTIGKVSLKRLDAANKHSPVRASPLKPRAFSGMKIKDRINAFEEVISSGEDLTPKSQPKRTRTKKRVISTKRKSSVRLSFRRSLMTRKSELRVVDNDAQPDLEQTFTTSAKVQLSAADTPVAQASPTIEVRSGKQLKQASPAVRLSGSRRDSGRSNKRSRPQAEEMEVEEESVIPVSVTESAKSTPVVSAPSSPTASANRRTKRGRSIDEEESKDGTPQKRARSGHGSLQKSDEEAAVESDKPLLAKKTHVIVKPQFSADDEAAPMRSTRSKARKPVNAEPATEPTRVTRSKMRKPRKSPPKTPEPEHGWETDEDMEPETPATDRRKVTRPLAARKASFTHGRRTGARVVKPVIGGVRNIRTDVKSFVPSPLSHTPQRPSSATKSFIRPSITSASPAIPSLTTAERLKRFKEKDESIVRNRQRLLEERKLKLQQASARRQARLDEARSKKEQQDAERKKRAEEQAREAKRREIEILRQREDERREQQRLKREADALRKQQEREAAERKRALEEAAAVKAREQREREERLRLERERAERERQDRLERERKERQLAAQKAEQQRIKAYKEMEQKRKLAERERELRQKAEALAASQKQRQAEALVKQQQMKMAAPTVQGSPERRGTMTLSNASNQVNRPTARPDSYEMTPVRQKPTEKKSPNDYGIDDVESGDSTDDDDAPRKNIPLWAEGMNLKAALVRQRFHPPNLADIGFTEIVPPDLATMFPNQNKARYYKRTSSAIWNSPMYIPTAHPRS